ncbi:MAG: DUF1552 domain-containing protein [Myxococcota bacterium]|nr:DUF1552 domain-containing protein [Myxococcota bacterium]
MTRKYSKVFSRRTLLRGAGTIAVGLPLLDAMRTTSAFAAGPEPVARAFNVFFGLGFPTPLQSEGYDGPLGALASLRDKLLIVRGVDQVRADESGSNAHYDGAAGAFTAEMPNGEARAGGPSIDQLLRHHAYPGGVPAGVIPTLCMGTYFRRSRPARYIHCWNEDGSPADVPRESPEQLFTRVFGDAPGMTGGETDPAVARRMRYRRSILDSVIGQYQHYTSDAGGLGAASRARLTDHLDRIREHELRVFAMPDPTDPGCTAPTAPGGSSIPHGAAADPDGEGIDITLTALTREWRLMSDLYALGVQCDRIRFGGVTFQAAGERIRLTGRYEHEGSLVYEFDDRRDRGTGGSSGCSHEYWHGYDPSNANVQLRAHLHLMLREVGYFMTKLDDPEHRDENGLTILENALVMVSTESGDGRHNDVRRELSGVFHAVSGANERFRTGNIVDVGAEGLDVYNTMLSALAVPRRLGPSGHTHREITGILR